MAELLAEISEKLVMEMEDVMSEIVKDDEVVVEIRSNIESEVVVVEESVGGG